MDQASFDTAVAQLRQSEIAAEGLSLIDQYDGDVEAAMTESMAIAYGGVAMGETRSLKDSTLTVLRSYLCGDEGFQELLQKYLKNPKDAAILTGAVTYLLEAIALPFAITPAIATLVVLYILRFGIDVFCENSKPGTP